MKTLFARSSANKKSVITDDKKYSSTIKQLKDKNNELEKLVLDLKLEIIYLKALRGK